MNSGDLKTRIRIEQRQAGLDDHNEQLDTWEPVMSLWAMVRSQTGMGVINNGTAGVDSQTNAYSFRVRYRRAGVTTGMRVVEIATGQIFDIRDIRHDIADKRWTDIVTATGGSDG